MFLRRRLVPMVRARRSAQFEAIRSRGHGQGVRPPPMHGMHTVRAAPWRRSPALMWVDIRRTAIGPLGGSGCMPAVTLGMVE